MTDQLPAWAAVAFLCLCVVLGISMVVAITVAVMFERRGVRLPERMRVPLGSDDPSLEAQELQYMLAHLTD